jgi:ADP-heptose:LPS heptosyltransferase
LFTTHRVAPMEHFSSKLHQFLAFADWLEIPSTVIEFGLRLTDAEERRVEALLAEIRPPFVAAFVGSSCESRLWFPDRTAAVVDALAEQGIGSVLVGGPGDVAFAEAVVAAARAPLVNLAGRTTLRDCIGIFARAQATFGPDCGPMHIAAAVGAPVVSLWGATSPARSAPWGSEIGVIVGAAPCMPCYLKRCAIGRLCMQHIDVPTVLEKIVSRADSPGGAAGEG